jgi:murein DD-endopeptidase MepM/ murein hydrolase activator NlpD
MKRNTALIIIAFILFAIIIAYVLLYFNSDSFQLPVSGKVSSRFGPRISPTSGASTNHNGVDIVVPVGTPIKAKFPGEILLMYYDDHGGNSLIVTHGNGWKSGYAHLSAFGKFKEGDKFKRGDTIAFTGNTGITTAPHVHYTLTAPTGVKVDPELYIGKKLT